MPIRLRLVVLAAVLPMLVAGPALSATGGQTTSSDLHVGASDRPARSTSELIFEVPMGRDGSSLVALPSFSDDMRFVAWTQYRGPNTYRTAVRLKDRRTGEVRTVSDRDAYLAGFVEDRLLHFTARRGTLEAYPDAEHFILDIASDAIYPVDVVSTEPGTGVGTLPDTWVVFSSSSDGLVEGDQDGDSDIFVRNLMTGEIRQMTALSSGARPAMFCTNEQVADGQRWVIFTCSEDLVSRDNNRWQDCYAKSIETGELRLVSVPRHGRTGRGESMCAGATANARQVAFISMADNFGPRTKRQVWNTFVKMAGGAVRVVSGAADALVDSTLTQYQDAQMVGVQDNVAIGDIDGSNRRLIRLPNGRLSDEGVHGQGFAPDGRAIFASSDHRFGGDRHRRTRGYYLYRG